MPGISVDKLLYPSTCILCGQPGDYLTDLCSGCWVDLPVIRSGCLQCGLPLSTQGQRCGRCQKRPPSYDRALIPWRYEGAVAHLVTAYKFNAAHTCGGVLGRLLSHRIGGMASADTMSNMQAVYPELLVPIPLHRSRLRRRGFNQALELAKTCGRLLAVPVAEGLIRQRSTASQADLSAAARRRNLKGAFAAQGDLPASIALIDDVVTTGTTMAEAARTLKAAGVRRVEIWAPARALK